MLKYDFGGKAFKSSTNVFLKFTIRSPYIEPLRSITKMNSPFAYSFIFNYFSLLKFSFSPLYKDLKTSSTEKSLKSGKKVIKAAY